MIEAIVFSFSPSAHDNHLCRFLEPKIEPSGRPSAGAFSVGIPIYRPGLEDGCVHEQVDVSSAKTI
jgi:hypothetical protein